MEVAQILSQARESIGARGVFGEPYEKNGVTVIPAAKFMGGIGGGEGTAPATDGEEGSETKAPTGSGVGFGATGRPTGAFVVKGDEVSWVPAVDVNRIVLGFQVVLVVFFLTLRAIAKSRAPNPSV